jgi:hypothetical protein
MTAKEKKLFGGFPLDYSFWNEFKYHELTENVRQKGDLKFSSMLNRIRIGIPNIDDIKSLESRKIPIKSDPISESARFMYEKKCIGQNLICLCSTIVKTEAINAEMLLKNKIICKDIEAEDTEHGKKVSKKNKKQTDLHKKKKKISDTAGLETNLIIGENARVMLRRNIDLDKGLCNGAVGTVKKLCIAEDGYVQDIIVNFDSSITVDTKISRVTADYELSKNIYVTRSQFPLTLAWALTIHKSQGLSLKYVLIDLGDSIFESGMAYVALSRAHELENVYLIDFSPVKLICNPKAIQENNRLRSKYEPNLYAFTDYNKLPIEYIIQKSMKKKISKPILKNIIETTKMIPKVNYASDKSLLQSRKEDLKIEKKEYFLKLSNNGTNSCYANSIIQALLSCGEPLYDYVSKKKSNSLILIMCV